MASVPSLSVIVTADESGGTLRPVLTSAWGQRGVTPEIVVVVCPSSEADRAWLESERARVTHVIQIPAGTRFDAMNAGQAAASGDWVLFLSTRDRLVGDAVLSEALNWLKKTESGVAAGEVAFDDGRIQKFRAPVNALTRTFVPLPAAFYRRALFAENGGFDVTLHAHADYEFNVRLWKSRVRFKPLPLRIAASSAPRGHTASWRNCREEIAIRHRYFSAGRCLVRDIMAVLRWTHGRIFGGAR